MCVGLGFFRFDALTEAIKAREGVVAYTREAFGDLLAGFGCAAAVASKIGTMDDHFRMLFALYERLATERRRGA